MILEGLFLEDHEYVEHLAKSADGIETVKLDRRMQPDIAIIDISTSYLSGIETTKQIKEGSTDTTALIASVFEYQSYIPSFFQAGVNGDSVFSPTNYGG